MRLTRMKTHAEFASGFGSRHFGACWELELPAQVIPAIMSGRAPTKAAALRGERYALPIAADHPDSLFRLLRASHRLRVHESFTALCPEGAPDVARAPLSERLTSLFDDLSLVYGHVVLPSALAAALPSVSDGWGDFRGLAAVDSLPNMDRLPNRVAARLRSFLRTAASRLFRLAGFGSVEKRRSRFR